MLEVKRDAAMKTRFKMWWRLVGSAIEHAAALAQRDVEEDKKVKVDFHKLFLAQDDEDEDSVSLADALAIMQTLARKI